VGYRVGILLAFLSIAPAARAEIYACPGPGGETLYTTDASQCGGAVTPHALKGQVQRTETSPAAVTRPRSVPAARRDDASAAAEWAARRRDAERAVAESERRVATGTELVKACNRGAILRADDENGIPHEVPCSSIQRKFADAQRELAERRAYLADGLAEDCRRAGCLPGWIR